MVAVLRTLHNGPLSRFARTGHVVFHPYPFRASAGPHPSPLGPARHGEYRRRCEPKFRYDGIILPYQYMPFASLMSIHCSQIMLLYSEQHWTITYQFDTSEILTINSHSPLSTPAPFLRSLADQLGRLALYVGALQRQGL